MKKPLTPSAPPSPASDHEPPTDAWPIPQPGDVLSYAYLWSHEAAAGREEGLKNRLVVVVVASEIADGSVRLLVVPVTHSQPTGQRDAIQIPQSTKNDLGLDRERSWIITSELNRFIWPGPDIRIAGGRNDPFLGAIPARLFEKVRAAILALAGDAKMKIVKRTE